MSNCKKFKKYRYNLEVLSSRLPLIESQLDEVYAQFLGYWSTTSRDSVLSPVPVYESLIIAVQNLGLGWSRDPLGKHKVFIPKYQV